MDKVWLAIGGLILLAGGTVAVNTVISEKIRNTLGFRLHNPMNIERGTSWIGLASQQPSARYTAFIAPEFGIRAGARILRTYHDKYGLNTIRGLINRFAPGHENPTDEYISNVAKWTGVGPDQPIHVPSLLFPLVSGIIRQEIGFGTQPYPEPVIRQGLALERDQFAAQAAVGNPRSLVSAQVGLA